MNLKPIVDLIVKKLMVVLISKASFLAIGPLNYIATKILTKILTKAIDLGLLEIAVLLIKVRVNGEIKTVKEIIDKYKIDEDKEILDEKLSNAYDDLFKL